MKNAIKVFLSDIGSFYGADSMISSGVKPLFRDGGIEVVESSIEFLSIFWKVFKKS